MTAPAQLTPPACDSEVYEHGEPVCMFHAASAPTEGWVRKVRAASGQRVDWHYVGGYAVVRFIGERPKVLAAIERLMPDLVRAKPEGFRMLEARRG